MSLREGWDRFLEYWVTPAGAMILLGGIVWGVQLNLAVIDLTRTQSKQDAQIENLATMSHEQALLLAKVSTLLDTIEKRVDGQRDELRDLNRGQGR